MVMMMVKEKMEVKIFSSAIAFLLCITLLISPSLCLDDTSALIRFRLQADSHGGLLGNWTGSDACGSSWRGVQCSVNGRVIALSLPSMNLRGPIESLAPLDQLRVLDLHDNRLNGTISAIVNCTNLKLLYLSGNDFSGEIPPGFSSLRRLLRLDLSDNNIRGGIPEDLSKLSRLLTLRLQNNVLSGTVPDLSVSLVNLTEVNLSNNELYGRLPDGMVKKFGEKSFAGNEGVCGSSPLPICSVISSPPASDSGRTVPSNPISIPKNPNISPNIKESRKGLSPGAIVAIVIANCVALLVIISFVVAYYCARDRSSSSMAGSDNGKRRKSGSSYGSEKRVYANGGGDSDSTNATDRSKLVFFDWKKQFELEDLLRASAEMLGKGSLGTVYRAVLDDGCTVAVKRLKDANPCNRGPGRIPLDWTTRISLLLGAARGLARIHGEYSASKIPHGNVKSSNVLLDKNGVACISDFGLSLLLNPVHAIARLGGYKAPEQDETKRLSQKADVYSFGVLMLEVLTGRAPSLYPSPLHSRNDEQEQAVDLPNWVRSVVKEEWTAEVFDPELLRYKNIEEELVSMLHVGLACVLPQPEKRPTMVEVAKMIEDIRVEQSPLGEDYDESRNSLSPSLATTEDGMV
ncbi:Leucine-rich repeat receptor-like protein kinase PXC1, partial [Cucurbita argyrosperma subsp. sororia]